MSFPQTFDYMVVVIEESRDLDNMKIEELQVYFEAHELRLNDWSVGVDKATKLALQAQIRGDGNLILVVMLFVTPYNLHPYMCMS